MANFIDVSSLTYSGKEAQEIFAKDVYDIDLRNYGVTYMDGVKGKTKIYSGDMGEAWQEYTCPFSPKGKVSLAESFIEPKAIKVNQENCYDTFWNTFLVDQTSISLAGGIPQTFADWYFDRLRKQMAKEYQEIAWQGDTARTATTKNYLKVIDGWEKQLKAKAQKVTGETFTVDNIIGQVEALIMKGLEKASAEDVPTDGYKVFMNYADVKVLEVALGKLSVGNSSSQIFGNYSKNADGSINVYGFQVVPTMMSKNKAIFGPAMNLVLGYDTFDSHIEYKLIDMRETTLDNTFRVAAISNIAVGVVLPELFTILG